MSKSSDKSGLNRNLEKLLSEVDYAFLNHDYKPSANAIEFINFIKQVNGKEGEENKSPVIHMDMLDNAIAYDTNLFVAHRGSAKALSLDTRILTLTGSTRMGDIRVGDTVIDRNGAPTKVVMMSEVFHKPMYLITLADGRKLKVSEDHINIVKQRVQGKGFVEKELTTKEILDIGVHYNRKVSYYNPKGRETRWYIPLNSCIQYPTQELSLDPYTVGVMLGDGNIGIDGYTRIHTHVDDIDELCSYIPYPTSTVRTDARNSNTVRFSIRGISKEVKSFVGTHNAYSKRIPHKILIGSEVQRLETLRGLMDTDGTTNGATTSFTTVSKSLAKGVAHLVRSLGGGATVSTNNWKSGLSYRVFLHTTFNPFKLSRKSNLWTPCKTNKCVHVGIVDIEPIPLEPSKCIKVASETSSFLTSNCIVTHNTTALHEYVFLYIGTYGEFFDFGAVEVAMYISDTIDNGVKSMRKQLQFRWENSDFLQQYIPTANFTDTRWEFINTEGHKFVVRGFGASTGVRGFKEYGKRPTWCGFDDLMSDKNAESPTITQDITNIIYKAARQAMHPKKRKIIWTGTPFNKKDPLYKAAGSKAWNTKVYPICEKFPCTREEFRGSWEDRFSYDFVKKEYDDLMENGQIAAFNQELMLKIASDEDRLIQDSDIKWYKRNDLLPNIGNFNIYITTDFATSEEQKADFSTIGVWAYNHLGQFFLVDGVCKRQQMDKNLDDLFRLAPLYRIMSAGIEVTGQQGGFVSLIQRDMMTRNTFFNLASDNNSGKAGIRPSTNKFVRFHSVAVPMFKRGEIWLPEELKDTPLVIEILEELQNVTLQGFKSAHDDCCDMISMLGVMPVWKPSATQNILTNPDTSLPFGHVNVHYGEVNSIDSYIV